MRSLVAVLVLAFLIAPGAARADDVQACIDASDKGQVLRIDKHLRDARAQFAQCGRLQCPAQIRESCVRWLDETERAIATIVFALKDERGADVTAVRLAVDDRPMETPYDGSAVALDPGEHTFRFEAADGSAEVRRFRVAEGERDRRETIVFGHARQSVVDGATRGAEPTVGAPPPGLRVAGIVAGAAGIAGIATGGVLGGVAIARNNAARCDAANVCVDPQARRDAQGIADGSTVAFVAGGALLAAGVTLFLLAPRADARRAASVRLSPAISHEGAGIDLRATW